MKLNPSTKMVTLGTMTRTRKRDLPKYVYRDSDRYGNVRLYYWLGKGHPKTRLREKLGTKASRKELACAELGIPYEPESQTAEKSPDKPTPISGSLDWLIESYEKRGAPLVSLDLAKRRLRMLKEVSNFKKKGKRCGRLPFSRMERRHIMEIRDTIRETPGARNNVVKSISAMFHWAIEAGIAQQNPAIGIKRLKSGDGFHTVTPDEVDQYIRRHPPGTMAYRALVVFMFTGLRLADGAIAGRQHLYWQRDPDTGEAEQWFKIRPAKTENSSGVIVDIPVLPELAAEIERMGNEMTFIQSSWGRPFSVKGLGNRMKDWFIQAGLPHCSTHGLRKAGATIAAENGADYELLKSIFGWTTAQQASHYVQKARRRKIAASAGRFLKLG